MGLIDRIKAKTDKKNRIKGQISTAIGTTCAIVLTMGLVANPIGIIVLTFGSILFGGDAVNRALKTTDKKPEENAN